MKKKRFLKNNYIISNKKNNLIRKNIKIKNSIYTKKGSEILINETKISDYLKTDRQTLEIYDGGVIKLFMDIDIKESKDISKEKLTNFKNKLIKQYKNDQFYIVDFSRELKDSYKVSFHLIHKTIAFTNIIGLKKYIKNNYSYKGIDDIYKKYFALRAPNQSKWNEKNKITGKILNGEILDCLITINFKNYIIYEYLDIDLNVKNHFHCSYDIKIIKNLLNILEPKYYDDYNLWVKICYALKNISEKNDLYDIFIEFSKKSKKFNLHKANKLWYANINDDAILKITPKSIYYFAKLSNEKEYYKIINPVNFRKKFMSTDG
jgi:hypothetical protein